VAHAKLTAVPVLWAAILAGPVAWSVQLQTVYAASAWVCDGGPSAFLHLASLLALAAAAAGAYTSYRAWGTVGGWPSPIDDSHAGRLRLMSVLGMFTGGLFAAAIVAQWLAAILLPVCPTSAA
jgi:hypothetical protein